MSAAAVLNSLRLGEPMQSYLVSVTIPGMTLIGRNRKGKVILLFLFSVRFFLYNRARVIVSELKTKGADVSPRLFLRGIMNFSFII